MNFQADCIRQGCSCCGGNHGELSNEMTRRKFVRVTGTGALGTVALPGISWSALIAEQTGEKTVPHADLW